MATLLMKNRGDTVSDTVLEFNNVVKSYGSTLIVDNISFTVARGEFFTLLGPSGCGKTTTLRLLAGLEEPESGEITLEGKCLAAPERGIVLPPDKRGIGMMFQSYAIWPHLSVFENVAFPLRVRHVSASEIKRRVDETLELVGLTGTGPRGATQLSGGQQQRVALARAIVHTPSLLLLDEPLSNLDVKLREQMRIEIRALQSRLNLAVVYVTHDQSEALAMSDRIAILNKGRIEQVGTPVDLYERPRSRFVSTFLGQTVMINGTMRRASGLSWVDVAGSGQVTMPLDTDGTIGDGAEVRVLSRPETINLLPAGEARQNEINGKVERVAYMGSHLEYTIQAAGRTVVMQASKKENYPVGAGIRLALDPEAITVVAQ
jgi:ABC-type Fe3+/spermidine/putrescine transport system ATPase subunit